MLAMVPDHDQLEKNPKLKKNKSIHFPIVFAGGGGGVTLIDDWIGYFIVIKLIHGHLVVGQRLPYHTSRLIAQLPMQASHALIHWIINRMNARKPCLNPCLAVKALFHY
ncbi:hypothetical protein DERF_004667 [Dermatophagoides farinae]|uniref:Uncharacterized protein n=1 Tax=Dermatophagoides farinae TaxID=6954 RepID=A0A922L7Y4_DERFA|nr:hypothetical protein DERF_004667 [Dermatophagoides farinae]